MDTDTDYEDVVITKVKAEGKHGWAITRSDGWQFFVPAEHGIKPKVGDVARFYGEGIGHTVRGLAINGATVFYRTAEEQRAHFEAEQAERHRKKREEYAAHRAEMDARVAALPAPFRKRIEAFRAWREDWGAEFEAYELFTCEQAVAIAAAFPSAEQITAFAAEPWERQKEMLPALSDEHSGNTFGAACHLAAAYAERPATVPESHGALCPLVGCRDYGCFAARIAA